MAGIDITIFKDHSFRGASTSKAVTQGVSLGYILKTGDILKTADGKNAGTFAKFYKRSSPVSMFASAILMQCPSKGRGREARAHPVFYLKSKNRPV